MKIGKILLLLGAVAFLGLSFMPWYQQTNGVETAWDGEESLGAAASAAVALLCGVLSLVKNSGALRFFALLGAIGALVLTYLYFDYNGKPIIIRDMIIPSGLQKDTVQLALAAAGVMTLGGLLGLRARS